MDLISYISTINYTFQMVDIWYMNFIIFIWLNNCYLLFCCLNFSSSLFSCKTTLVQLLVFLCGRLLPRGPWIQMENSRILSHILCNYIFWLHMIKLKRMPTMFFLQLSLFNFRCNLVRVCNIKAFFSGLLVFIQKN